MNLYNNASNVAATRPLLRSLLQKCVRRGYGVLAQKVAHTLASRGDSAWLQTRTSIIIFEECWPASQLLQGTPSFTLLNKVANLVKNKDAAGLGSLGYALAEGDSTVITQARDPLPIKIVAAALKRPASYFKWVKSICSDESQTTLVNAAMSLFPKASWPWDKAFIIAGAYLCTHPDIPKTLLSENVNTLPFPFWTAIDKHTPQGKLALSKAAKHLNLTELHLQWISFYFESAKTNEMQPSPWWDSEINWRFASLGLDLKEAENIWTNASLHIESAVKAESDYLQSILTATDQHTLFQHPPHNES